MCQVILTKPTWACELKYDIFDSFATFDRHAPRERVSWNLFLPLEYRAQSCHAPRERVSWNAKSKPHGEIHKGHAPRERVSWNADVKPMHIEGYRHAPRERVSWNCSIISYNYNAISHAPRERVSWNVKHFYSIIPHLVTLHVSVWVEIFLRTYMSHFIWSRSTWACELK